MANNTLTTVIALFLFLGVSIMIALNLGGDVPTLPKLNVAPQSQDQDQFNRRIQALFENSPTNLLAQSVDSSPFFTRQFVAEEKPKPEPKRSERKVKFTLKGFFGEKAILQIDDQEPDFYSVGDQLTAEVRLLDLNVEQDTVEVGSSESNRKVIKFGESQVVAIPQ